MCAGGPLRTLVVRKRATITLFVMLDNFVFACNTCNGRVGCVNFTGGQLLEVCPLFVFLVFMKVYVCPRGFSFATLLRALFKFTGMRKSLGLKTFSTVF